MVTYRCERCLAIVLSNVSDHGLCTVCEGRVCPGPHCSGRLKAIDKPYCAHCTRERERLRGYDQVVAQFRR